MCYLQGKLELGNQLLFSTIYQNYRKIWFTHLLIFQRKRRLRIYKISLKISCKKEGKI